MKTIVIISQKGGSGKSTLAINLAGAALLNKRQSLIIDTDSQQSVYNWFKARAHEHALPYVISSYPANVEAHIETARQEGADYVIVDTAPHSSQEALVIAKLADLILVPCKPTYMDLVALEPTTHIVAMAAKPALAVLSMCPHYGADAFSAAKSLAKMGFTVAKQRIGLRAATSRAHTDNHTVFEFEPKGKAAAEFKALYRTVAELLEPSARQTKKKEPAHVQA